MHKNKLLSMVVGAFVCSSIVVGCSNQDEPPKSIQDISSAITKVEQSPDNKKITVTIKQDSIFQGGNATKDVLNGIMSNFKSLPFDNVEVIMDEVLVDKYGKEFIEPIISLNFPRSEIERIDFKNVVGWNILNISTPHRIGTISAHIVAQECAEENNAKYASEFCNNINQ